MKLKSILFDQYIEERNKGSECELAYLLAMDNLKEVVILNYSEELKHEYFDLKQELFTSHALTQQMELTFKMQGVQCV